MRIVIAALLLAASGPATVLPAVAQQVSAQPVPGALELNKLVWTTMVAVDQANQSGNYSVLRDLSAPGFQQNNDAARLAQIFANLRAQRIDLSNALLLAPTFTQPAAIVQPGVMRVQGLFGLRPVAITFDLTYQWVQGQWKLFGVSIGGAPLSAIQPGANPPPATPARPNRR